MVHSVDRHSSKSITALLPPTASELEKLAIKARTAEPGIDLGLPKPVARSLRRRLTPDVRQAIISRYAAGESAKALSQELNISRDGVRRLLRDAEVTTRPQDVVTPQAIDQIVQLYAGGLTIRQVVEQVGYSFGTVQRVLSKHGGVMRVSPVGKRPTQDGKASHS